MISTDNTYVSQQISEPSQPGFRVDSSLFLCEQTIANSQSILGKDRMVHY